MNFYGFRREDGAYGVRNHVAIISSVICSNGVVEEIARQVPGVLPLTHSHGCGSTGEITLRTLSGVGKNPNIAAVLVVGLGCEASGAPELAEAVANSGKRVEYLVIQENGGTYGTVIKGAEIARKMLSHVQQEERVEAGLEYLTVGFECGGSDAFSGITANPAAGVMADMLVAEGGTAIISEITEMVGTAHLLKRRAASPAVAKKIEAYVKLGTEASNWDAHRNASRAIAPGNMEGGLTSVVEKSLGCIMKGGTTTITDCIPYAVKPSTKGLVIMETDGYDIESMAGMAAGGAQVIVFTTGRGSPSGFAGVPVIKVVSNSTTYKNMEGDLDINAGAILDDGKTIQEVGRTIFELMIKVAGGELTKSEKNKQNHFAIRQEGFNYPTLKDVAGKGL
ncbi:UxaA family hydrolase [Chloroflexota bacterium]